MFTFILNIISFLGSIPKLYSIFKSLQQLNIDRIAKNRKEDKDKMVDSVMNLPLSENTLKAIEERLKVLRERKKDE